MEQDKHRLIYLTGFMGSGKSTIAPILANTLGYANLDIDLEIERRAGKKISVIFSVDGEVAFRGIEQAVLRESTRMEPCVVALGGGTITYEGNLDIIKKSGILVYLKSDAEGIYQRVKNKKCRPLLQAADGSSLPEVALRERIEQLLALREPYYKQADVTVPIGNTIGSTVDAIVRAIRHSIA